MVTTSASNSNEIQYGNYWNVKLRLKNHSVVTTLTARSVSSLTVHKNLRI